MIVRSEKGLSLVETMVAITIFALFTVGIVPLLGTAMRGGAMTRTESVGRNLASKTLERLRGLQYHVAYSGTNTKVDLLDHFFPGRTPGYAPPTTSTGFETGSNSFVTTCAENSTAPACKSLPSSSEIPAGYSVEIRLTFKDATSPATTVAVPTTYAWNAASDQDKPPSDLVEISVTSAWTVGSEQRTFNLQSYLSQRDRQVLPTGGSGGALPTPPPTGGGGSTPPPPTSVKLRAEAKINYGYQMTTTYRDTQTPARLSEFTGTLGTAVAYGEQLDSGSKADLTVRAGQLRMVRPADPAVSGDVGVDVTVNGASHDAHAPPNAGASATSTAAAGTATHPEITLSGGMGFLAASEAGSMTGARGAGPTVANGLPFVKGYYDFNATTNVNPSFFPTHMWMKQTNAIASPGTATTLNPIGVTGSATSKTITVNEYGANDDSAYTVDPRGEVMIDSTPTSPGPSRVVTATSTIPNQGEILLFPSFWTSNGMTEIRIQSFSATLACNARADAGAASTATGSWDATLEYMEDPTNNGNGNGLVVRKTTLPTQTLTTHPVVPAGTTNPLQAIKNQNGGNGPLIFDASDNRYDVFMFAANGKRGLLSNWSMGSIQTSISADDRVASAQLDGAIRMETMPFWGPYTEGTQVSQRPESDVTFSMGNLACKAEDYR
jgi:type II secretory pathway pseudopilin PulG